MKCPFREIIAILHGGVREITTKEFGECYESNCPYWDEQSPEKCRKAAKEKWMQIK